MSSGSQRTTTEEVFRALVDFMVNRERAPSTEELGDHIGMTRTTAYHHLAKMKQAGWIKATIHFNRIKIVTGRADGYID